MEQIQWDNEMYIVPWKDLSTTINYHNIVYNLKKIDQPYLINVASDSHIKKNSGWTLKYLSNEPFP